MSYVQKSHLGAATTGYVIPLGRACGKVTILTAGRAAFKVGSGTQPSTPTNAYLPTSGNTVDTIELPANGEFTIGSDPDGRGFVDALQDPIEWVAVWCEGGGLVNIVGH